MFNVSAVLVGSGGQVTEIDPRNITAEQLAQLTPEELQFLDTLGFQTKAPSPKREDQTSRVVDLVSRLTGISPDEVRKSAGLPPQSNEPDSSENAARDFVLKMLGGREKALERVKDALPGTVGALMRDILIAEGPDGKGRGKGTCECFKCQPEKYLAEGLVLPSTTSDVAEALKKQGAKLASLGLKTHTGPLNMRLTIDVQSNGATPTVSALLLATEQIHKLLEKMSAINEQYVVDQLLIAQAESNPNPTPILSTLAVSRITEAIDLTNKEHGVTSLTNISTEIEAWVKPEAWKAEAPPA